MAANIKAQELAADYKLKFDDLPTDPAKIERLKLEVMKLENTQRVFATMLENFLDHQHARDGSVIIPLKKMQPIIQHLRQLQLNNQAHQEALVEQEKKQPWWKQLTDRLQRSG